MVYETFESNEMMYTKLSSGETYDVLVPSDYMIERLIKEEYLQHLDWDLIPNKKNLKDEVVNRSYDPGNRYSCPYFYGTVGILYDTTVVDEADLKDGWNLLANPKYKGNLYMYYLKNLIIALSFVNLIYHQLRRKSRKRTSG